ncbi:unnamed protein product [Coregonus sp. 'balchen']|nr:unnamed protein product [Coregonus sp. 'balchen']
MEERIIFAVSSKPCLFETTADSYKKTVGGSGEDSGTGIREKVGQRKRRRGLGQQLQASGLGASATFFLFWIHLLCLGQRVAILQLDPLRHPQVWVSPVHQDPLFNLQVRPPTPSVQRESSTSATTACTGAARPSTTSLNRM